MRPKRPSYTRRSSSSNSSLSLSLANEEDSVHKMRRLGTISENTMTPLNEPFQPDDADLMLFSSDGLGFKVHRSRLVTCSSIFKTTLSLSMPTTAAAHRDCPHDLPELHFPDSTLESSITISLFLHLLYTLPLPIPTVPAYFQAYETLLTFLLKYECKTLYVPLGGAVRGWVKEGLVSTSKGLKMGDRLDDVELCKESVRMAGEYSWVGGSKVKMPMPVSPVKDNGNMKGRVSELKDQHRHSRPRTSTISPAGSKDSVPPVPPNSPSRPSLKMQDQSSATRARMFFDIHRDGIEGAASLDLTAVPFEFFCSLSDETKFALLRAGRVGSRTFDGRGDEEKWGLVAEEYGKIMDELRAGTA
ncbi:hypothetical protein IAU59_006105 [Kwoniella sp. CBS 9459]